MRVLITGAGGFIGRHLVADQLDRGRQVTAIDIRTGPLDALRKESRLKIVEADFTNSDLIENLPVEQDVVFHLASLHLETSVDEASFWRVNAQGALDFLKACHQAEIGRFVHCSSVGVFGDIQDPPADEETECRPDIIYEMSKLEGEQLVRSHARQVDFPLVVVRPAWVYGPDCPRTLKLSRSIKSGRFFYVGDGSNLRHPIYIDDMLEGFELAATHPNAPGEVFIMAGPEAVTIRELVATISDELEIGHPRLRLPRSLVWFGGLCLEKAFGLFGRNAPFSRRSLKFFSGNTAFSIEKARRTLDFEPQVGLPEGMRKTLEEMRVSGLL